MWLNSWQDWSDFIERRRLVTRINLWRFMADVQSKFVSFGRIMILTTDKIITLEITKRIADQLHGSITSAKAAPAAGGCSVLVITISNAPNPTDRAAAMSTTNLVSGAVLPTDEAGISRASLRPIARQQCAHPGLSEAWMRCCMGKRR